mgnify:CR=1 FL=1
MYFWVPILFSLTVLGCSGDPAQDDMSSARDMVHFSTPDMAMDMSSAVDQGVALSEEELRTEALLGFFTTRCERFNECYSDEFTLRYGDISTCLERMSQWSFIKPEIGAVASDIATIQSCTIAWEEAGCLDVADLDRVLPSGCDIRGSRENGEACWHDFACKSGHCDNYVTAMGKSRCEHRCIDPLQPGDECQSGECGRGQYCRLGTCVRLREIGEACEGLDKACRSGLDCVDGVCVRRALEGESCYASKGFGCAQDGLECERVEPGVEEFVCVRLTEETRLQEFDGCAFEKHRCRLDLVCGSGRYCTQPLEDGEACEFGADCNRGRACTDGICQYHTPENACGRSSNEDLIE